MQIFLGLVALMPDGYMVWRVKGGNHLVPIRMLERLLKQTDIQFVRGHVKSVAEIHRVDIDDQGGSIRLSYQPTNSEMVHAVDYNYTILAFPLHRDNINDFVLPLNDKFNQSDYRMQSIHVNFLHGKLNCQPYNLTEMECERLGAILYTDPLLWYRGVGKLQSVNQNEDKFGESGKPVYKIFSPEKLVSSDYEHIFDKNSFELIQDIPWLAYPKYEYPQKMPPIKLNENIFYLNGMEWSSSCMEIEAISARNIAMLVTKKLGIELKRKDKLEEF